jgi:hypothetical protein
MWTSKYASEKKTAKNKRRYSICVARWDKHIFPENKKFIVSTRTVTNIHICKVRIVKEKAWLGVIVKHPKI